MQNETNIPEKLINSLLAMNKGGKSNNQDTQKLIRENLNEAQQKKLEEVLRDPKKLSEILSSPQAKMLLKRFSQNPPDGIK